LPQTLPISYCSKYRNYLFKLQQLKISVISSIAHITIFAFLAKYRQEVYYEIICGGLKKAAINVMVLQANFR
jgi:hypothetical protein